MIVVVGDRSVEFGACVDEGVVVGHGGAASESIAVRGVAELGAGHGGSAFHPLRSAGPPHRGKRARGDDAGEDRGRGRLAVVGECPGNFRDDNRELGAGPDALEVGDGLAEGVERTGEIAVAVAEPCRVASAPPKLISEAPARTSSACSSRAASATSGSSASSVIAVTQSAIAKPDGLANTRAARSPASASTRAVVWSPAIPAYTAYELCALTRS